MVGGRSGDEVGGIEDRNDRCFEEVSPLLLLFVLFDRLVISPSASSTAFISSSSFRSV